MGGGQQGGRSELALRRYEELLVESLLMRYRVDELAARCGLSVDTVRYYQTQGLLDQPERDGRVAWYSDDHVERLEQILELKAKGFTLAAIRRFFAGELDRADEALVLAVTGSSDTGPGEPLTLEELAERTGISASLLNAIAREGLLTARIVDGVETYSTNDIGIVEAGLELLSAGLPLSELLALARDHDAAMKATAETAVEMFLRYVRDPIRANAGNDEEAAQKMVEAFHKMLPATTALVAQHFKGLLMREAEARISEPMDGELDAVKQA